MNINSINKLSFVMGGVCERLKENEELFVRAEGVMKSGTVEYAFLIVPKNNSYEMSLNKELSEGSFEELVSKIKEALKNYAVHPDHVAVADNAVRPFTATRSCLDYII